MVDTIKKLSKEDLEKIAAEESADIGGGGNIDLNFVNREHAGRITRTLGLALADFFEKEEELDEKRKSLIRIISSKK